MNDINIDIKTNYLEDQSRPADKRFVFSYTITLTNQSNIAAQLISRHWIITDESGTTQEVQGIGVVGEQPHLGPGETYSYTSGVVLDTETGTMEGSYQMRNDEGSDFDAPIPAFALVPPHAIH